MKKRILCAVLCLVLALSIAGCGAKKKEVNPVEKISTLSTTDEALGLKGKYTALSDVTGGSVDAALVGKWVSADGKTVYTYAADGTQHVHTEDYGDTDLTFTCITCGDYRILCEQVPVSSTDADGNTTESTALSYTAYSVDNDALYMVSVEEANPDYNTHQTALLTMYRADKQGSAAASMAKNPIALSALNGTWTGDKGTFTIENGTLTLNGDSYALSFNDKNQLVAEKEKDGGTTAYGMAVTILKDHVENTENIVLALSYTGADENDRPNLLPVLDDWKADYDWDTWYYTGSFQLQ